MEETPLDDRAQLEVNVLGAVSRYFSNSALEKQMSSADAVAALIVKAALTPRTKTRYRLPRR